MVAAWPSRSPSTTSSGSSSPTCSIRPVGAARRPRSPAPDGRRDALHRPDRLPVALPARALRGLDGGLGSVAARALERCLGAGDGAPRGDRPRAPRSRADPVDGHGRCPDGEGRPLRPTFHEAGGRGGRTIGTKRTLLVEILGLPLAARADSARPHDVVAARELLRDRLDELPRLVAIVGDRAYRGLARLAERKHSRSTSRRPHRVSAASSRSGRSIGSSTPSPSSGAGGGCRAAMRAPLRALGRGWSSPRSATSPGEWSPDRASRTSRCARHLARSLRPARTSRMPASGRLATTSTVRPYWGRRIRFEGIQDQCAI